MDDGFQNPALAKNFSVLVMDKRRGLGNGRVFPAGPLRAPLEPQMRRADALVVVGESPMSQVIVDAAKPRGIPVFRAALVPDGHMMAGLAGRSVLAFAGIGDPEKFFATLKNAGVKVAATRPFADHHRYSRAEADALSAEAARAGLTLVTTEKDMARLKDDATLAGLATRAEALPVTLALDEEESFRTLLLSRLIAARAT
jgi:tetraacyldisaccharide 4'-kinase